MPRPYTLKNEMTSDSKIQRLLKKIEDNAKADRKEALALVKKAKDTLGEIETRIEISSKTNTQTADAYTSVFNAIILALNQAGIANERLIKLATVIQKFTSGKKSASDSPEGSLFSKLVASKSGKDDDD